MEPVKYSRNRALAMAGRAISAAISAGAEADHRGPSEAPAMRDQSSPKLKLKVMGRGLSRTGVVTEDLERQGDHSFDLVALVPHGSQVTPGSLSASSEARLLGVLDGALGAIRVPRGARAVQVEGTSMLVMERVYGMALDPTYLGAFGLTPWGVTAEVAAAVHGVAQDKVSWLGGADTRRDHGLESLQWVGGLDHGGRPEARDALAWMGEHLPPEEESRLLHGDLLAQNVLVLGELRPPMSHSTTLIDWACARRGDPAFDIAMVTRGVRRPFKESGGLRKLLDAYAHHGGAEVTVAQVRFHEIALLIQWHAEVLARPGGAHEAHSIIQRVPALLR